MPSGERVVVEFSQRRRLVYNNLLAFAVNQAGNFLKLSGYRGIGASGRPDSLFP